MRFAFALYVTFTATFLSGWASFAHADLPMTGAYVPELQSVDALLQSFMAGKPIPGGTIAITHDDKVIYERGIGYSNEARTVLMQETALMRLASVSKPITASAIQQLAKDGQLSLDDKVFNIDGNGGILNITPHNGTLGDSRLRDITLQHLLEHKGGWNREIAGDTAFQDVYIATTMGVPSPPGIANSARYILSQPLQFTPGSAEYYSNIGYMFLGMVVESASGQAYEDYVENHVLAPAGIPAWEVDAGRSFAADQNPREPVYSSLDIAQNVFNPGGPLVSGPYGGWDHEKFLAFGGLIASSKAMALLAQNRIASGPEIGKLRSEYTANPEYTLGHLGALPGTLTLMVQESSQDLTYSILFDGLPADWSSSSISLFDSLNQILEGLTTWPEALVYAGDFTNDQWLTPDDITLFTHALALGSEAAFMQAYPTARYSAGDFDGNGQVNALDSAGLIGALQHAGVPADYIALVPELPGDFNRDGAVDAADYVTWRKNLGLEIGLPNETMSLGLVNEADYDTWRSNFGTALNSGSGASLSANVPEPTAILLFTTLVGIVCCYSIRRRFTPASKFIVPIFSLVAFATSAHGDIFQWEYINPADPTQSKQQSTTIAPDGAGVDAVPGADLSGRNLTMAYLIGADLSLANLSNANLFLAALSDADFAGAEIRGANFKKYDPPGGCCFFGFPIGSGITTAQLYSTASYQAGDLNGINFGLNEFAGGNFVGQNLTNASFNYATLSAALFNQANLSNVTFGRANLTRADFGKAIVTNAGFGLANLTGAILREANLADANFEGGQDYCGPICQPVYATLTDADFSQANLTNAHFGASNLTGVILREANLTNTDFRDQVYTPFGPYEIYASLTNADLTAADARGAPGLVSADLSGATTANLIWPGGHINGLDLDASGFLVVRDYDGNPLHTPPTPIPIVVDQHLTMGPSGTLRMVFEADAWDSTISFAPGIPVTLGGTLELTFADNVNPASQLSRTLKLFDWTGVTPTGAFAISSPYAWDLSNLYTTGQVTLTAIPEPASLLLIAIAFAVSVAHGRRAP
jgi:uncharacterized protein YjbI with pentapeptide repeats/CubicO group peptidase (beta-lactamase class C family)